jgi:hypothetical protein
MERRTAAIDVRGATIFFKISKPFKSAFQKLSVCNVLKFKAKQIRKIEETACGK